MKSAIHLSGFTNTLNQNNKDMSKLKLKTIYHEVLFLTWLGLSAQQIHEASGIPLRTVESHHKWLIRNFTSPNEAQTMVRVLFKARAHGVLKLLLRKFAVRFAKQIKDAKKLPNDFVGVCLED